MRVFERLKAWRQRAGLSQADAAAAANVKQSTWSDWERGRKKPHVSTVFILAELTEGEIAVSDWSLVTNRDRARIAKMLSASPARKAG